MLYRDTCTCSLPPPQCCILERIGPEAVQFRRYVLVLARPPIRARAERDPPRTLCAVQVEDYTRTCMGFALMRCTMVRIEFPTHDS